MSTRDAGAPPDEALAPTTDDPERPTIRLDVPPPLPEAEAVADAPAQAANADAQGVEPPSDAPTGRDDEDTAASPAAAAPARPPGLRLRGLSGAPRAGAAALALGSDGPVPGGIPIAAVGEHRVVATAAVRVGEFREADEPAEADSADVILPVGAVFAARYRVEESLPADGPIVRAAGIQEPMVRRVALSALDATGLAPQEKSEREERFLYDAGVLAALRHPNVAATYDYGRTKAGICYAAHESLYGFGLDESLARGPLSAARFPRVARQLVRGLAALHDAGVVHRNVGPHAIVLEPGGGHGVARWTRFGLGQRPADVAPAAVPDLLAPEFGDGVAANPASDVWALGVTLHIAAVGTPPPRGRLHPDVPAPWKPLIRRCLEEDADLRFASASDMLKDLPADKPVTSSRRAAVPAPLIVAPAPVVHAPPPPPPASSGVSAMHFVVAGAAGAAVAVGMMLGLGIKASMRAEQAQQQPPVVAPAAPAAPADDEPRGASPGAPVLGVPVDLPELRPGVPLGAVPVRPSDAPAHAPPQAAADAAPAPQLAGRWVVRDPAGVVVFDLLTDDAGHVTGRASRGGKDAGTLKGTARPTEAGHHLELDLTGADGTTHYSGAIDATGARGQVTKGDVVTGPWASDR